VDQTWQPEERLFLHLCKENREASGSGKRYFGRGSVKYALLELLEQENMHGYQMMKALEEQSGGTYKPSAGSIYPTLQMLRDQGFVEAAKEDGKKVFHITDAGRDYLREELARSEQLETERSESGRPEPEEVERPQRRDGEWQEEEGAAPEGVRRNRRLTPRGKELLHLLKAAERAALADAEKAAQLRIIIEELRIALVRLSADVSDVASENTR
jgi:DNA-binding PadR family transcriptional regulator